jgi:hypothetical protein
MQFLSFLYIVAVLIRLQGNLSIDIISEDIRQYFDEGCKVSPLTLSPL